MKRSFVKDKNILEHRSPGKKKRNVFVHHSKMTSFAPVTAWNKATELLREP